MNLDLHTLATVLGLSSFLQMAALYAQYRANQSRDGLYWWTLGSGAFALGFFANALREVPGAGPFAIVANNGLFILGGALNYVGVLRFFHRRAPLRRLAALVGLALVLGTWFTFGRDDMAVRRVILSTAIALLSLLIARTLWANRTPAIATSAGFLALVFGGFGAFFLARAASPLLAGPAGGIFTPTPLQKATYLAAFAGSILWNFGFIIMVNQRLNAESREAKEHFEAIFHTSPNAVLITREADGTVVDLNRGFTALTGYSPAEALGRSSAAIGLWDGPDGRGLLEAALDGQEMVQNLEFDFRHRDGRVRTGTTAARRVNLRGEPHVMSVTRDITDWKRVQQALVESHQFLSGMIENNGALIYVKDPDGRYDLVNKKWEEVTGLSRDAVLGRTDVELFPGPVGRTFRQLDQRVLQLGQVKEEEEVLPGPGGERCFLSIKFPLLAPDRSVRGLCGMSAEITQRKLDEQRIQELVAQLQVERDYAQARAQTDGLTLLANRRQFDEVLNNEFYRLKRSGAPLSLIMLDVDHFKAFNDLYGHLAGDDCLRRIAHALQGIVGRTSDLAARYGGEEFAVVLPETGQAGALTMAERVRRTVAELAIPHLGNSAGDHVTVSLGVVSGAAASLASTDRLIQLADEALYRAKQEGRNRTELAQAGTPPGDAPDLIRLVWRESAESGNPVIDSQHRTLFEGSNALLSAVLAGSPQEHCSRLVGQLLGDVGRHFRDEEAIIRQAGFPLADQHAALHAELVSRASALAGQQARGELAIGELFSFLAYDVVAQHMFREDRKFFPYL